MTADSRRIEPDEIELLEDYIAEEIPSWSAAYDEILPIFAEEYVEIGVNNNKNGEEEQNRRGEEVDIQPSEGRGESLGRGSQTKILGETRGEETGRADTAEQTSNTTSESSGIDKSSADNHVSGGEQVDDAVRVAEAETDTNPSEAQKEAGNYKKGHIRIDGYDISIENPKGSVSTKVVVEMDVSNDEFVRLRLKDKVIQVLKEK